jgi:hypothetical protein
MFGGYLPVERTTDYFFFKTPRQLGAQREENAHPKHSNKKEEGIYRYLSKTEIRGQGEPPKRSCPLYQGGKENVWNCWIYWNE